MSDKSKKDLSSQEATDQNEILIPPVALENDGKLREVKPLKSDQQDDSLQSEPPPRILVNIKKVNAAIYQLIAKLRKSAIPVLQKIDSLIEGLTEHRDLKPPKKQQSTIPTPTTKTRSSELPPNEPLAKTEILDEQITETEPQRSTEVTSENELQQHEYAKEPETAKEEIPDNEQGAIDTESESEESLKAESEEKTGDDPAEDESAQKSKDESTGEGPSEQQPKEEKETIEKQDKEEEPSDQEKTETKTPTEPAIEKSEGPQEEIKDAADQESSEEAAQDSAPSAESPAGDPPKKDPEEKKTPDPDPEEAPKTEEGDTESEETSESVDTADTASGNESEREQELKTDEPQYSNRVVVISGSDGRMKNKVLPFIKQMGLEPVNFRRDNGQEEERTLHERIQEIKDIGFALIFLTIEDCAYPKNEKPSEAKVRTSQDVIFELGLFVGKLTHQRIFVLYPNKLNFELPSRYFDVFYTPYDDQGRWKLSLVDRLRNCGYPLPKEIVF